jgi:hypothetical protein
MSLLATGASFARSRRRTISRQWFGNVNKRNSWFPSPTLHGSATQMVAMRSRSSAVTNCQSRFKIGLCNAY